MSPEQDVDVTPASRAPPAGGGSPLRRILPRAVTAATRLSVIAWIGVGAIAMTPISDWMARPLLTHDTPERADAIIVLAGFATVNGVLNEPSLRRTLAAAELFDQDLAETLIVSGGNAGRRPGQHTSDYMAQLAIQLGVDPSAIEIEYESHRTYESAVNVAEYCRRAGIESALIVTSATHTYRAKAVFEAQGLKIMAIPSEPRSVYWENPGVRFSRFFNASYEYLAISFYRFKGWM